MKVSIIIKALNEEKNIESCIKSAQKAVKGMKAEIIVVDSRSTDKTIAKAKKFPIKIIKLTKKSPKSAAAAVEAGYQRSRGEFIYILDGDMELDPSFIQKALSHFKGNIAGVGGIVHEPDAGNILSKRAERLHKKRKYGLVNYLDGGGLYKRSAIEKVGYLANPHLTAGEESELGFVLKRKGFLLKRIKERAVTHHAYTGSTWKILFSKWNSGYLSGFGQVLKSSARNGYFFSYLWKLKIYVSTFIAQLLLIISLIYLGNNPSFLRLYAASLGVIVVLLLVYKRSVEDTLFSLFSWNIRTLGVIKGLFKKTPSPPYNGLFTVEK